MGQYMRFRTLCADLDILAKVALFALDLHAVPNELFKSRTVEDTIFCGLAVIYNKFVLGTSLSSSSLGLVSRFHQPTEKITQQSRTDHLECSA